MLLGCCFANQKVVFGTSSSYQRRNCSLWVRVQHNAILIRRETKSINPCCDICSNPSFIITYHNITNSIGNHFSENQNFDATDTLIIHQNFTPVVEEAKISLDLTLQPFFNSPTMWKHTSTTNTFNTIWMKRCVTLRSVRFQLIPGCLWQRIHWLLQLSTNLTARNHHVCLRSWRAFYLHVWMKSDPRAPCKIGTLSHFHPSLLVLHWKTFSMLMELPTSRTQHSRGHDVMTNGPN